MNKLLFLGVKSQYRDRIRNRIEDFGFVEGEDFTSFAKNLTKPNGGRPVKEYFFSHPMAKELCMVERNAKGKEARLYFTECERIAKEAILSAVPVLPNFLHPAEAAVAWAEQYRKVQALEHKGKEDAPKVAFTDQVQASNIVMPKTEVAKLLDYPPRKFDDFIRRIRRLYSAQNMAMQWAINAELMVHRFIKIKHSDDTIEEKPQPYFTTKGVFYVYKKMLEEGLIDRNPKIEMSLK